MRKPFFIDQGHSDLLHFIARDGVHYVCSWHAFARVQDVRLTPQLRQWLILDKRHYLAGSYDGNFTLSWNHAHSTYKRYPLSEKMAMVMDGYARRMTLEMADTSKLQRLQRVDGMNFIGACGRAYVIFYDWVGHPKDLQQRIWALYAKEVNPAHEYYRPLEGPYADSSIMVCRGLTPQNEAAIALYASCALFSEETALAKTYAQAYHKRMVWLEYERVKQL